MNLVSRISSWSVAGIGASPEGTRSRSGKLLERALEQLDRLGAATRRIELAALPAEGLLGRAADPAVAGAIARVADARLVIVATPVYRASYSGLLKVFLDLLPESALAGKVAIPIASGGSAAHQLAIDHALRPLLASLGALVTATGIYGAADRFASGSPDAALLDRLDRAVIEAVGLVTAALTTHSVLPAER